MGSADDTREGKPRSPRPSNAEIANTESDGAMGARARVNDFASESPVTETDLPKGTSVGEYVIIDVLGRGGFGIVYRAVHPLIGKRVAIKLLSRKFSSDGEMVSRFMAEARAVNQIRHRNIIDIFSFGQLTDGRHYYVMEHLEGEPLDQHLATNGPLRLDDALPILRAVARALDAAHAKGVAHRDLKPENVFLARDDEGGLFPKLLDFGIAKLSGQDEQLAHKTNTGVPFGTPYYMSPEQCRGKDVDYRTDIYSFGMLAYRLLTGTYAFDGALIDILHQQMYDEPPAPSSKNPALTPEIDTAIAWMIKKEAADRPKTAISAVLALQASAATPMLTPTSMAAVIAPPPVPNLGGNRWIIPVLAGVVVLAGAAVAIMMLRGSEPASEPESVAGPTYVAVPADAPGAVSGVPDAAVVASRVNVTVAGVPHGTEVVLAGAIIGTAPGRVQLPVGDEDVVLTFRADGYTAQSKTIRPDRDQALKVTLKQKRGSRQRPDRRSDDRRSDDDDVIHVFGKEPK